MTHTHDKLEKLNKVWLKMSKKSRRLARPKYLEYKRADTVQGKQSGNRRE